MIGDGVGSPGRTRNRNVDGIGDETRAVAEMRTGARLGTGTRMGKGTGTRTGSKSVEARERSARNGTRVVDTMWETGETWLGGKRKNT